MKQLFLFILPFLICIANGAVISDDDLEEQGLYSKSDHVMILTRRNFEKRTYGQKYALVIQFYNSYCGHCRAFAPKFKSLASSIKSWQPVFRLAVLDCSVEENNALCREFEVMAYPSLRYLHENYVKGNHNIGDKFASTDSENKLKMIIIQKLLDEQSHNRLKEVHPLSITSYTSYVSALEDIPPNVMYTFLIFEAENSTVGPELIMDTMDYENIRVKRVYNTSELANVADIRHYPGLVAVRSTLDPTPLTPKNPNKDNLLKAINYFLKTKNYLFPHRNVDPEELDVVNTKEKVAGINTDVVYYSDLEKTIKTSLHTEITRYTIMKGEPLEALRKYLNVLITSFPFKSIQLRKFIVELKNTLSTRQEWSGSEVYDIVKRLEAAYKPVYSGDGDYISCKGSDIKYRGYTCGLWTLFHTLTVNAVLRSGNEGPKVLEAIHGYVKYFFGCTECAEHYKAMAERNRMFDVKENDKAVLWLWISHNEVNLRLANDVTEDPVYPKIQFPSVERCPDCRLARGAWNLPSVYQYLIEIYGESNIQDTRSARSAATSPSLFTDLDIGMLSLLYMPYKQ